MRDSYRIGPLQLAIVVGAVVLSGVLLIPQTVSLAEYADWPTGWLITGWLVFAAVVLVPPIRPATVITGDGITVRRLVRTTVHPWREIADIQFEQVTGPFSRITVRGAVLYDADLRRRELPYLTDRRLSDTTAAELATAELHKRWVAARGPLWQPRTTEVEQLVETRRSRNQVWQHAIVAAAVGVLLALLGIVMVAQALPDATPQASLLLLVLPLLAFVGTAVVGLLRRRRDRSR